MSFEIPSWLNIDFVEKVLRESEFDNSIKVTNVFRKPATNKGDNFTSDMLRVTVEYTRQKGDNCICEKKSIIVKLAPQEKGARRELIFNTGIFELEGQMMSNALMKMNNLLKPHPRLSARCLYKQLGEQTLIVIEDLAPQGFRMAERTTGLDYDHALLVIRGLARLHGSSVAICEKEPQQKEIYTNRSMFSEIFPADMKKFFVDSVKTFAKESAQWPEINRRYSEKIEKLSDDAYSLCCKYARIKSDEFNVINHGDTWVNNLMFRYDEDGKPAQQLFVDFQFCNYTSPATDLMHFLNSSVNQDVFENHQSELIDEYLKTLTDIMKHIGCKTKPPTRAELDKMLKERAFYGLIISISVLPFVLLRKEDCPDINEMLKEDSNFATIAIRGDVYRKVIHSRLTYYDQMGLLD